MKAKNTIRIGNGQGFWGDSMDAPVRMVEDGPLDFLGLDYLAEVTMSIMQKLKGRDPRAGYATANSCRGSKRIVILAASGRRRSCGVPLRFHS